jgi:hypothetical protein
LSVTGPHRFAHHVDGGVGVQHVPLDVQTPPLAHVAGHTMVCAQELVTVVPHLPAHTPALSGVQHAPLDWQTSPAAEHAAVPFAPQATVCPQLFVATPQFLPAHVVVAGSGTHPQLFAVHVAPPSHPPQSTFAPQLS